MSMHLTRHTTTGKSRAKFKYSSAEQKRQALELQQNWSDLKQRHSATTVAKSTNKQNNMRKYKLEIPAGRGTEHIPSLSTGVGTAFKNDIPMYTGNSMIGIAVQHKSCLQPVFSQQEAKESATMRRG